MVKKIYLMRHAKALDSYGYERDSERELSAAGIREAVIIGKHLHQNKTAFDLIISSTAKRAMHTAMLVADCLGYPEDQVEVKEGLYQEPVSGLLRQLSHLDESYHRVLLVAHNPAISFFAEYLSNADIGGFAPATLVQLEFEGNWEELSKASCTFNWKWDVEDLI
jgi:phosphohistidine phosphatase